MYIRGYLLFSILWGNSTGFSETENLGLEILLSGVSLFFFVLLYWHTYHYPPNGMNWYTWKIYFYSISRVQQWQLQKHGVPTGHGKRVPRSLRLVCSKKTISVLLVCHDFPLAQNLSKEAKVLDPLLQYSLRKLSDFKFLTGKEASFPQSSHYKHFLQNKL